MDEEQQVRAAHAAWIAAVNAGDLAWLLDAMTQDVVFINPGQAPFGREQFPTGFNAGHAQYALTCSSELEEVVVVGDFAWTRARDAVALVPRNGGEPFTVRGHRLTLYRRQGDGRWLLARDAHTVGTGG